MALAGLASSAAQGQSKMKKNFSAQDLTQKRGKLGSDMFDSSSTLTGSNALVGRDSLIRGSALVRESGSDILVLKNPSHEGNQGSTGSRTNGQDSMHLDYQATVNEIESDLLLLPQSSKDNVSYGAVPSSDIEKEPIRESGSDLLILTNPSQPHVGRGSSTCVLDDPSHKNDVFLQSQSEKSQVRRYSSDIEVLTPSSHPTGLGVAAVDGIYLEGSQCADESKNKMLPEDELSPCGSLTNRTVSAMIDHMYKSVYESRDVVGDGQQVSNGDGTPTVYSGGGSVDNTGVGFSVWNDDNQSLDSFHSATTNVRENSKSTNQSCDKSDAVELTNQSRDKSDAVELASDAAALNAET